MGIIRRILGNELTTDVLDVLTSHHTRVDELFEQIEKGERKREAFVELANLLAAHATVEEKIFYPGVMTKDTADMLHESVEEHLSIKRIIADLVTMKVDDATFTAKVTVLKEQVSHHAHKEEEAKLFPKVKSLLGAEERAALGNQVVEMFETLIDQSPMKNVPDEIGTAAPLPRA